MPKVTVLMSVHNGEKYLREAIESILNQTFKDFEFLIVNDGSTDSSKEIILSYDDPRIVYVENETNIGLTKSLNKGLKLAKGEYIARMDADDWSYPKRLEVQNGFLDSNSEVVLAGSLSEIIEMDGSISFQHRSSNKEQLYYDLTFSNIFAHSSVMFRKKTVADIGGYDESFSKSQDFDLWYRLSRRWPIALIDKKLLRWRNSSENISNLHSEIQQEYAKNMYRRNIQKLLPENSKISPDDLLCFHKVNILGWSRVRVGFKKILLLKELNRLLIGNCPAYIEKKKLKKIGHKRIALYFKKMIFDLIRDAFQKNEGK